jgi:hypothetical protein
MACVCVLVFLACALHGNSAHSISSATTHTLQHTQTCAHLLWRRQQRAARRVWCRRVSWARWRRRRPRVWPSPQAAGRAAAAARRSRQPPPGGAASAYLGRPRSRQHRLRPRRWAR